MEDFSNSRRSPWHQEIRGVVIGSGVATVGDYAFSFCTKITDIVIPKNIKSIGQYAFSYCIGLKSVEIRNSPDKVKLDSGVFPSGVIVKFTENGREVHQYTVADYEEEVYENDAGTELPQEEVKVSNTPARPSADAVLEENDRITWKAEKGVLTISGEGPMTDYSASNPAPWGKNITSAVIESGITSVGSYAFYNCSKLKSVVIPDTVVSVEDSAFAWCTALEAVDLPKGLTKIGKAAFSCSGKLASIEIPSGVTEIPDDAFAYCDRLRGKLKKRR